MEDLKFDLYAMVHPKNDRDILAICDEALAELAGINRTLKQVVESAPAKQPA